MALVKKYIAEVIAIKSLISGVYTLDLKPLNGTFKFQPGQFLHLTLEEYDPSQGWPESRCFSIQSSPIEKNLRLTYAVKSSYTKRMAKEIMVGKVITVKLPYGELFSQEHSKENTVFIAGGTGITPFLSLFTDLSFASYMKPVLYAGFRNAEMNFYKEELELANKINSDLEIHLIYQDKDGILDIEKIFQQSKKVNSYFISGPPTMISLFKKHLRKQGVTENQIRTDDWE